MCLSNGVGPSDGRHSRAHLVLSPSTGLPSRDRALAIATMKICSHPPAFENMENFFTTARLIEIEREFDQADKRTTF